MGSKQDQGGSSALKSAGSASNNASSPSSTTSAGPPNAKPSAENPTDSGKSAEGTRFVAILSVFDLIIYGIVFMVPVGPFALYAQVYDDSQGMPTLAYFLGGLAMIFTAFSFGVMAPRFPSSGSIYAYAAKGVGTGAGFVTGWMMIMQYMLAPDVMVIMAGNAMTAIPGLEHFPLWGWCLLFLAFNTFVAVRGIGLTILIDRIALVCELIVLGLFIGFTTAFIINGHTAAAFSADAIFDAPKFNFSSMFSAVSLCVLAYIGFDAVATLTEESKDSIGGPRKAMILIVIILVVLFCLMAFVATCADPDGSIMKAHPTNGFYVLAGITGGEWFAITCEVTLALADGLFTALASQVSIARVLYVMSESGAMPKWLGKMNQKRKTPVVATVFVTVVSLIILIPLLIIGQATDAEFNNFGALAAYCMINFTVIYYCFFKCKEHKIGRHLIMPLLGMASTLLLLLTLDTTSKIVGIVWIIIGIVVYLIATKKFHHKIDLSSVPTAS